MWQIDAHAQKWPYHVCFRWPCRPHAILLVAVFEDITSIRQQAVSNCIIIKFVWWSPKQFHFILGDISGVVTLIIGIVSGGTPQWEAADAEIKVSSGENTELKRSPFKAWSRSVYSHTCYAYCQEFLPRLFLPFRSIHLHFLQNLSQFFPVLAVANTGSCVGPQNKIGHPVGCRFPCWVP